MTRYVSGRIYFPMKCGPDIAVLHVEGREPVRFDDEPCRLQDASTAVQICELLNVEIVETFQSQAFTLDARRLK